jgi:coenzyme F420-0:L-glutamate ligase/coenzyme F420-1:gamma-L-glutamate ligase
MVHSGDDLVTLVIESLETAGEALRENDLIIVTSKVVSKSEGQVVDFDGTDEHKVAIVEGESRRVLRRRGTLRITETRHGFINANAGVDLSNTEDGTAILLPKDPDRSARRIRAELTRRLGVDVAVLITDTFGRVWRQGVTDVALGSAGLRPVLDLRGTRDATGRLLEATEVAIADEIAGAANLVLHKSAATPFALVRGLDASFFGPGSVSENIVRSKNDDLFR